ncbi:MAG: hypothetical protein GXP30_06700 [Verrucomicrobia bacterium]|nr:hypothetical protein [Verrucomicrobiota bacterium]
MKNAFSRSLLASLLLSYSIAPLPNAKAQEEFTPEPENYDPQNPVTLFYHVEKYRFFVNFGTTTRSINAGFQLDGRQTTLDWRRYINQQSGRGNVGLYRGGSNTVRYDNGFVGPNTPPAANSGGAGGYVSSNSQISPHSQGDQNLVGGGTLRSRILSFQTDNFRYLSTLDQRSVNVSDTDIGVGAYFQLGYHIHQIDSLLINFVTGGSFIRTNHSSGNQYVAKLNVTERRTDYTYQYDYLSDSSSPLSIPGVISGPNQVIVTDPSLLFQPPPFGSSNYRPPRQSQKESTSATTRFYALSRADLDVSLNEIPLGFEIGREIGPFDVFLTGGTTVNIINYDLSNTVNWYQAGRSNPVMRQKWRDSGTPVRLGFYSGLTIRLPLKRDGRVLLETRSSYRWVDPVRVSAGIADVEIDPSSWEAGIGIVIILE